MATMTISVAEEMNPARRNTMEDVHVAHPPASWGAPDDGATFLGVYDGHGGRLIADYLEDHLAKHVAKEWTHAEGERRRERQEQKNMPSSGCEDGGDGGDARQQKLQQSKKRRLGDGSREKENSGGENHSTESDAEEEGRVVQTALERAFLLTDIQSRVDGITTSGATVVCCVVVPRFASSGARSRHPTSISIHAANAGDARAVLSSSTARPARRGGSSGRSAGGNNPRCSRRGAALPNPELPSEFPVNRSSSAVRITHDHKSTDPEEIARIESAGGIMIRNRVLGVLAVARSLGDHGLKEYVIARPHLSSTVVRIEGGDDDDDDSDGGDSGSREISDSSSLATTPRAPFTDGEFLIVACDGLWDVMDDQEAVDLVRNYAHEHGRERVSPLLIKEALRRGSADNITVIVYWL